jgi:hypothetical protein
VDTRRGGVSFRAAAKPPSGKPTGHRVLPDTQDQRSKAPGRRQPPLRRARADCEPHPFAGPIAAPTRTHSSARSANPSERGPQLPSPKRDCHPPNINRNPARHKHAAPKVTRQTDRQSLIGITTYRAAVVPGERIRQLLFASVSPISTFSLSIAARASSK